MTKINFDPELMRNIKIIYGDANLDNMTLQNIYETWQRNPEIIRNTARQKMGNLEGPKAIRQEATSAPQPTIQVQQQEIADDDLRGVQNFGAAFKEARRRGLKQFRWGKGVYGTQLAQKPNSPNSPSVNLRPLPKPESSAPELPNMQNQLDQGNSYIAYKQYHKRYPLAYQSKSWDPDILPDERTHSIWMNRGSKSPWGEESGYLEEENRGFSSYEIEQDKQKNPQYYQQGGTMNNQQELQKAFMAYLIQDAQTQGIQIQSEQDLQAYAEQLGEDGIKAKYQEFMQKMQGGVMARLGAKLQYYKKLKGVCPEGEELVYFKQGGRICKACQKAQKGTKVTKKANEVDKFKAGRAQYKKDMKSAKDEASRDSVSINKYNDQETMANKGHKGNFKNGKWVPDRTKYTKKDACGSKMKVSK